MDMKRNKIEELRNKEGYINLDKLESFIEKGEIVEGSNAKQWFNFEGVRFLFKEYDSVLPAFGEVLYSRIADSCGVDCAEYDFATYKGAIGTISYDFLGEEKAYYNFLELTTQFMDTKFTLEEIKNNRDLLVLHNNKYNNLFAIKNLLEEIFNDPDEKERVEVELIKQFCLDVVFWHKDRRLWNYGVVVDECSDAMFLAPSHDNSHVLCLEKGKEYIESVIYDLINGESINDVVGEYSMFDEKKDDSIAQLLNFYEGSDKNVRKEIENVISNINIEEVEKLRLTCQIGDIELLWIKAVLNYRKSSILNGIENAKIVEEDVPKKPNITFSKRK